MPETEGKPYEDEKVRGDHARNSSKGGVSSTFQTVRFREHAFCPVEAPSPRSCGTSTLGETFRAIGQCEILRVGMHALSKHFSGQIACSLGRTNSIFATNSSKGGRQGIRNIRKLNLETAGAQVHGGRRKQRGVRRRPRIDPGRRSPTVPHALEKNVNDTSAGICANFSDCTR